MLFCHGHVLEADHFPANLAPSRKASASVEPHPPLSTDPLQVSLSFRVGEQSLADIEDRIITDIMERTGGNKSLAAKHLGITRWMLDRRRKR